MNPIMEGLRRCLILCLSLLVFESTTGLPFNDDGNLRGPAFVMEPPSLVEFTNETGSVITCSAQGQPSPRITWTQKDGQPLREIPGARHARPDGALYFPPFPGDGFRQGVHDAVYRCMASNVHGTIVSREVHVKAVVLREFKVRVYNEFVVHGNTAVLRCQVPPFIKDHMTFTWKRGDGTTIVPNAVTGGRFSVLQSGELYIRAVTQSDALQSYGCEARHQFTGAVEVSTSSANLFVTEPHGSPRSPHMVHHVPSMSAREGESLELACAASSFPPPTYRWYREEEGRLVPLNGGHRISQLDGSLIIQFMAVTDSGRYICVANNSAGEDRAFTTVTISSPLSVIVHPKRKISDVGRPVTFNCSVFGHPLRSVGWLKDGLPVEGRAADTSLNIPSVRREDIGMYQCFAYNDFESAQGSAELKLGEGAPVLLSTFKGDSIRPGISISLKCSASGNPLPQVTWFLDDSPIPEGPRFRVGDYVTAESNVVSYVNISDVRTGDGGEYACVAANVVATVKHTARLDIFGPPYVRKMSDATAVAGRTITIRCPVSGYPIEAVIWKKDGVTLPVNHRQRMDGQSKLTILDVQKSADEGTYSCEALGSENRRAAGKMRIKVLVPPVIETIMMPELLAAEEGKKAKVMCTVTQGDPPLQITWNKNNVPLPLDEDFAIQNFEDSSILIFRKIFSSHSGNYTCFASNAADTVNRTTTILVNVAPRWSVEPANSFAVLGQAVIMDCAADGQPTPYIQWKKATGTKPTDFHAVISSYKWQVFDNGSLSLQEVSEMDAGHYLCQASNGIGAGLSKVIQLKVHTPPRFDTKFESHTVARGKDAELRCEATGDPDIKIQWEKDKQLLDQDTLKRLSTLEESGSHSTLSRLTIRSASRSDSALYTCIATNPFGRDDTNMQLVVQEPPSPPVELSIREVASRSVTLGWAPAFSGNSPVIKYIVQYGNASEGVGGNQELNVPGLESGTVVRGLIPASSYQFRVVAENALGRSEPGHFVTTTTSKEAPGGPPLDVQVHPTGSQSLKVTWKAPRGDLLHGTLLGYYIGYKPSDSDEPFQYKNVEATSTPPAGGLSYLTNLRRLTRYSVMVQAYNSVGAGPRSDEVVATTLEAAPPTSPILTLHSVTSSSITVTWERPPDDTDVKEYVLHYKADGSDTWLEQRVSTGGNQYKLEWLRCGTGYRLYMTATNSLGTGEAGDVLAARTKGAAPLSPQRDFFLSINSTFVTLRFGAWSSGGCAILHFTVHRRVRGQWEVVAERMDDPQMDIRHLVPNRDYTIRVSAHSEAGTTEAEYRFVTLNLTVPAATRKSDGRLFPPDGGLSSPYRNLAILLPVVISVIVLVVLIVTVIVCLRRQMDTASTSEDSRKGRSLEHMGLNEFQRKESKEAYEGAAKSSYYSSPARKPLAMAQSGAPGDLSHTIKKYSGWS